MSATEPESGEPTDRRRVRRWVVAVVLLLAVGAVAAFVHRMYWPSEGDMYSALGRIHLPARLVRQPPGVTYGRGTCDDLFKACPVIDETVCAIDGQPVRADVEAALRRAGIDAWEEPGIDSDPYLEGSMDDGLNLTIEFPQGDDGAACASITIDGRTA